MIQNLAKWFVAFEFILVLLGPVNIRAIEVGDQAPDFRLPLLTKSKETEKHAQINSPQLYQLVKLSDYLGTMVYVDFWASYCEPCRQSFPMLSTLRDQFDREVFEILAISNDLNPKESLRFLSSYKATFPVLSDPAALVAKKYGVETLPKGFLINAKGRVLLVHEGFQSEDIRDILAPVLEFSSRQSD